MDRKKEDVMDRERKRERWIERAKERWHGARWGEMDRERDR